jgi:hypothetical protein
MPRSQISVRYRPRSIFDSSGVPLFLFRSWIDRRDKQTPRIKIDTIGLRRNRRGFF